MMIVQKIQLIFGLLILVSPWVFGYHEVTSARWINVALGLVIVFTALFGILGREDSRAGDAEKK